MNAFFLSVAAFVSASNNVPLHAAPNYNVSAVGEVYQPPRTVSLADVYGKVKEVTEMKPWAERSRSRVARTEAYSSTRQRDTCNFPLEVVIIQDVTESFDKHFPIMLHEELPKMVAALEETHPQSSYGLVTCGDKPVWSLGVPDVDFCVDLDCPLHENIQPIFDKYAQLNAYAGADPQENQFGCILAAAQSDTMAWDNAEASRLIVLVTDAPPHFEGDGFQKPEYNMSPFSGHWDEANSAKQCVEQYYPNPDHVRDALYARQAYAAFVILDGNYWGALPTSSWEWFNGYIGQTPGFVGPLGDDSSSFWTSLADMIRQIELVECGEGDSTTENAAQTSTVTETESIEEEEVALTTSDACQCPDPCEPPCDEKCGCPEVDIRLAKRPKMLKLEVVNF